MKKLLSLIALSALSVVSMADDTQNTMAVFASTCYNSTAAFNGKDEACYLFMNPPTYWLNATQTSVNQWTKADLKMWMQRYIDYQNSQYQFFSQNVPYIHSKCPASTDAAPVFTGVGNPSDFPAPATKINQVNTFTPFWNPAWDATKITVKQVLNNLRESLILYETYAFYNLFYANNTMIRNITTNAQNLGLTVDLKTNRTYPGPSMNYLTTQSQVSNYLLSKNIYSAALFGTALRKFAYANYMATQNALLGTDYSGFNITIDTSDLDTYTHLICEFAQPTSSSNQPAPTIGNLIEFGANYVLGQIEGVANIAIAGIVDTANTVGHTFENGFDIVVTGLTDFGNDIANGFLEAANTVGDVFVNDVGGAFVQFGNQVMDVLSSIESAAVSVGEDIGDAFTDFGNSFCGVFGC